MSVYVYMCIYMYIYNRERERATLTPWKYKTRSDSEIRSLETGLKKSMMRCAWCSPCIHFCHRH